MDIMFYEVFVEEEVALKRHLPKDLDAGFTSKTVQAENHEAPPAPFISIRTQSNIPQAWAENLSGILTRSTGYDHLSAYRQQSGKDIACGYLPTYCSRSVGEHVLLLILALLKGLRKQLRQFEAFNRDGLTGGECLGRNLLVVGVGNIGEQVVRLAKGVGMQVKGIDLVKRMESLDYVSLEEGIRFADVIVCALPLTAQTQGMLGYESLKHARKGSLLVNVSRGEVTPAKDLKRLLDEGILGGLGLDVYEDENILAEHLRASNTGRNPNNEAILSMKDHDNVLFTPHNAFNTHEALDRKAQQSSEAVVRFLKDRSFPSSIPS